MNFDGFPLIGGTTLAYVVQSDGAAVTSGNVPEYKNSSGLLITDSGSKMSDKLSIDGSTPMTGVLDMNGQNINDTAHVLPDVTNTRDLGSSLKRYRGAFISELEGANNATTVDDIAYTTGSTADQSLAVFDGTNTRRLIDSTYSAASFLKVDGSNEMKGPLYMDVHSIEDCDDIKMRGYLVGLIHTRSVEDIVSSTGATTDQTIAIFSGTNSKVIESSGALLSSKLNVDGSSTMTGPLVMGGNDVLETGYVTPLTDGTHDVGLSIKRYRNGYFSADVTAASFRSTSNNFIAGTGATASSILGVVIGNNASTAQNGVAVGTNATAAQQATSVGRDTSAAAGDTVLGELSTSTGQGSSVIIGADSHGTAAAAHVFGSGVTNATTRTILLAANSGSTLLNIRSANAGTTDLGTTASPFNNLYCNRGYLNGGTRPIMSGGYSQITNVTVGNTAVETPFIGAGVGSLTSLANTLSVGNASRMIGSGTVGITVGTQTLTLRIYGGATSTTLLSTLAIALQTLTAAASWRFDTTSTVKSIGVGGTVQLNTVFIVNDVTPSQAYVNQTLANIDTTVNNVFLLTAQWTTANASNTITSSQFMTHSVYVV